MLKQSSKFSWVDPVILKQENEGEDGEGDEGNE